VIDQTLFGFLEAPRARSGLCTFLSCLLDNPPLRILNKAMVTNIATRQNDITIHDMPQHYSAEIPQKIFSQPLPFIKKQFHHTLHHLMVVFLVNLG